MSDDGTEIVRLADRVSALLYGVVGWLSMGFGSSPRPSSSDSSHRAA
ncbi:hypothetical protein [Natrononativus amylolyticus]|nr:hypothetical protein [Natrononativus amylolyticus]